jgi:hypothetical protein
MKTKFQVALITLVGIISIPLPVLAEYPIIFNNAKYIRMSQDDCTERAEKAVRRAGFTENFEPIGLGAFGVRGDYSASVRCETSKGIVFFAVAGPVNETTRKLVVRLTESF